MADAVEKGTTKEQTDPKLPEVTPLEGTTTLDDKMAFEPERLAYRSAVRVAEEIARRVVDAAPRHQVIVITGGELLADLANLAATQVLLDQLVEQYTAIEKLTANLVAAPRPRPRALEGLTDRADAAAAAIAGGAAAFMTGVGPVIAGVQAGIGLLSLFRENVQFTGAKTSVDQLAFQFAVASGLARQHMTVRIYETAILPALDENNSELQQRLTKVERARAKAWNAVAPHVKSLIDAQVRLDAASSVPDNKAEVQAAAQRVTELRQQMAPITDALERADTQFASLKTQLEKVDEPTGIMALGKLLRAERLRAENPRYLHVRVVSSGGHHRVSRNLLRMIFAGDGVSALGGIVARWAMLNVEGAFLAGGILDARRAADFPRKYWTRSPVYEQDE